MLFEYCWCPPVLVAGAIIKRPTRPSNSHTLTWGDLTLTAPLSDRPGPDDPRHEERRDFHICTSRALCENLKRLRGKRVHIFPSIKSHAWNDCAQWSNDFLRYETVLKRSTNCSSVECHFTEPVLDLPPHLVSTEVAHFSGKLLLPVRHCPVEDCGGQLVDHVLVSRHVLIVDHCLPGMPRCQEDLLNLEINGFIPEELQITQQTYTLFGVVVRETEDVHHIVPDINHGPQPEMARFLYGETIDVNFPWTCH
ncbi:uncharacterized protein LOC132198483 [Neocloeon triangulifer]|uniref:uncharacterized protein LOC132198483 n=1 Tax=Neocloeon triangulifer TaxID=2078957 RepID=UPI00286F6FDB|nr:uncharacterized protein LOC132198483 [Neocloeon triangulifer]